MRARLRGPATLVVPADERDLRVRFLSVVLTMAVAAGFGHWVCTDDPLRPAGWQMTWWACGMLGAMSAAAIAGWVGGRVPALIPVLLPVPTAAFTLGYMDLAAGMGHPLDSKYGIDVIGLSFFSLFAGLVAMLPVAFLQARLAEGRGHPCSERESYREAAEPGVAPDRRPL